MQTLCDRVCTVVEDLPVIAFHGARQGELDGGVRAVRQRHQRAIAAVCEVAVKVDHVVDARAVHGDIHNRGKVIKQQLCIRPLAVCLQTRDVKRVGARFVNVRGFGGLVVIVVGRNAEDVVVAVLCPDHDGGAVHDAKLHRVLVIAVQRAVHDRVDHLLGSGEVDPFEGQPLGTRSRVVDALGTKTFCLLGVCKVYLVAVLQNGVSRVGCFFGVVIDDDVIAPVAVIPNLIDQLDAVVGIVACLVYCLEIELVIIVADLHDLRVLLTVGGIAVRGREEHLGARGVKACRGGILLGGTDDIVLA